MSKQNFTQYPITEHITHIKGPMDVFMTLVTGEDKALLFDTGYGIADIKEYVTSFTSLPLTVVNSHGHVDHMCGNFLFDCVYLNSADNETANWHTAPERRQGILSNAKAKGVLAEGFDEKAYLNRGTGNIINVEFGHVFDLGGIALEVILTPGHTPGSISLLCRQERMLLAGDAANPFLFLFLPESTDVKTYLGTLYKIKSLDFDYLLLSHYHGLVPKVNVDAYIDCAENISVQESKPFDFPMFKHLNPLIYVRGGMEINPGSIYSEDGEPDPDFAAIIYTPDRLESYSNCSK